MRALQGSNFNDNLPNYVNFANLGFMIGRNFIHSLEYSIFYDLKNSVAIEKKHLDENAQCLKYQFSNYTDKLTKLQVRFE